MEPRFVTIRYERVFPYPVDVAYAWLTDYQDDDPQRAGALIKRRNVLSREAGKVRLDATIEMAGAGGSAIAEVALHPPDRWAATIVEGKGRGTVYEYRLHPHPEGSRLVIHYNFRVKRLRSLLTMTLARRRVWREIDRMWDGFEAAMRREIPQAKAV